MSAPPAEPADVDATAETDETFEITDVCTGRASAEANTDANDGRNRENKLCDKVALGRAEDDAVAGVALGGT